MDTESQMVYEVFTSSILNRQWRTARRWSNRPLMICFCIDPEHQSLLRYHRLMSIFGQKHFDEMRLHGQGIDLFQAYQEGWLGNFENFKTLVAHCCQCLTYDDLRNHANGARTINTNGRPIRVIEQFAYYVEGGPDCRMDLRYYDIFKVAFPNLTESTRQPSQRAPKQAHSNDNVEVTEGAKNGSPEDICGVNGSQKAPPWKQDGPREPVEQWIEEDDGIYRLQRCNQKSCQSSGLPGGGEPSWPSRGGLLGGSRKQRKKNQKRHSSKSTHAPSVSDNSRSGSRSGPTDQPRPRTGVNNFDDQDVTDELRRLQIDLREAQDEAQALNADGGVALEANLVADTPHQEIDKSGNPTLAKKTALVGETRGFKDVTGKPSKAAKRRQRRQRANAPEPAQTSSDKTSQQDASRGSVRPGGSQDRPVEPSMRQHIEARMEYVYAYLRRNLKDKNVWDRLGAKLVFKKIEDIKEAAIADALTKEDAARIVEIEILDVIDEMIAKSDRPEEAVLREAVREHRLGLNGGGSTSSYFRREREPSPDSAWTGKQARWQIANIPSRRIPAHRPTTAKTTVQQYVDQQNREQDIKAEVIDLLLEGVVDEAKYSSLIEELKTSQGIFHFWINTLKQNDDRKKTEAASRSQNHSQGPDRARRGTHRGEAYNVFMRDPSHDDDSTNKSSDDNSKSSFGYSKDFRDDQDLIYEAVEKQKKLEEEKAEKTPSTPFPDHSAAGIKCQEGVECPPFSEPLTLEQIIAAGHRKLFNQSKENYRRICEYFNDTDRRLDDDNHVKTVRCVKPGVYVDSSGEQVDLWWRRGNQPSVNGIKKTPDPADPGRSRKKLKFSDQEEEAIEKEMPMDLWEMKQTPVVHRDFAGAVRRARLSNVNDLALREIRDKLEAVRSERDVFARTYADKKRELADLNAKLVDLEGEAKDANVKSQEELTLLLPGLKLQHDRMQNRVQELEVEEKAKQSPPEHESEEQDDDANPPRFQGKQIDLTSRPEVKSSPRRISFKTPEPPPKNPARAMRPVQPRVPTPPPSPTQSDGKEVNMRSTTSDRPPSPKDEGSARPQLGENTNPPDTMDWEASKPDEVKDSVTSADPAGSARSKGSPTLGATVMAAKLDGYKLLGGSDRSPPERMARAAGETILGTGSAPSSHGAGTDAMESVEYTSAAAPHQAPQACPNDHEPAQQPATTPPNHAAQATKPSGAGSAPRPGPSRQARRNTKRPRRAPRHPRPTKSPRKQALDAKLHDTIRKARDLLRQERHSNGYDGQLFALRSAEDYEGFLDLMFEEDPATGGARRSKLRAVLGDAGPGLGDFDLELRVATRCFQSVDDAAVFYQGGGVGYDGGSTLDFGGDWEVGKMESRGRWAGCLRGEYQREVERRVERGFEEQESSSDSSSTDSGGEEEEEEVPDLMA